MQLKIKLREDSRNLHAYRRVGQTARFDFDDAKNFDDPNIPQEVQAPGNVQCGAYSCAYLAQNATKIEYDVDDLFNRVPNNSDGVKPNDIFGEVIKNGLLPKGKDPIQANRVKVFNSYHQAWTGAFDPMDNCRSAMSIDNSPLIIYSNWYEEWTNLPEGAIMPLGKTRISGHMYIGMGWFRKNELGDTVFVIEWWGGRTYIMTRSVFNATVTPWGCGAVTFSTTERQLARKSILEAIEDACKNLILLYRQLIEKKTQDNIAMEPKYLWDNPKNVRHSIRVICDESGLSWRDKNIITACIQQESGFVPTAVGKPNKNGTIDYGLCQYNNGTNVYGQAYWIGEGADFKDINEVLTDPEKNVRVMIREFNSGHLRWWASYSTGAYLRWMPK